MEKFSYEENGYNRLEVNQFVSDVIIETQTIINRCKTQAKEIIKLREELDYYKDLEDDLKENVKRLEHNNKDRTIILEEESKQIITKAKENANKIINEALLKAKKLEEVSKSLENNIKLLKRRINNIITDEKVILEELEDIELL